MNQQSSASVAESISRMQTPHMLPAKEVITPTEEPVLTPTQQQSSKDAYTFRGMAAFFDQHKQAGIRHNIVFQQDS